MLLALVAIAHPLWAGMDPRFELNPEAIDRSVGRAPSPGKEVTHRLKRRAVRLHTPSPGSVLPLAQGETLADAGTEEAEPPREFKGAWDQLVPPNGLPPAQVALRTPCFSLTLDPQRFLLYRTFDGAQILLDAKNSIPAPVKALIEKKDPSVRIVTDASGDDRRIWSAMLASGGFYSVEENFDIEFGGDPKLTVHSDFKIERSKDSVLNQNVVLLNQGRMEVVPALRQYLERVGFQVVEASVLSRTASLKSPLGIKIISATRQPEVMDAVLNALSLSPTGRDRNVEISGVGTSGISFSFKADRSLRYQGENFVITYGSGDPAGCVALFRILESNGYHVILLNREDGFQKTAEKILSGLKIRAKYGRHDLIPDEKSPVSLQMTGFWLEDPVRAGRNLFISNVPVEPAIGTVLTQLGYDLKTITADIPAAVAAAGFLPKP